MEAFKYFEDTTILTVDDDAFNQELALAVFDDFTNIEMLQAHHGKEAFALLEEHVVDLILLDLMMPEMDGFETLKYLKENPEYKDIPVIVVTSKEDEKRKTYTMGANDFISKPYNPEELKLRVYNHLRMKKFSELLYHIEDSSGTPQASSSNNLENLKEAVEIAIGSEKKLLAKLGNMSHDEEHRDSLSTKRMGEYAKLMGALCGLNAKTIDNLYYAVSIYDIGLLRVPKEYRKDTASSQFKEYPTLGISILDNLDETTLIKMAKEVILSHQENWDGSGYPNGLKGDEISLYAQIVSIIHLYNELTTAQDYNPNVISSDEALDIIKREREIKFSSKILDLFVEHFEEFRAIKNRWS